MSIAVRIGAIVGIVLFVVLAVMFVVLRVTQESAMRDLAQRIRRNRSIISSSDPSERPWVRE